MLNGYPQLISNKNQIGMERNARLELQEEGEEVTQQYDKDLPNRMFLGYLLRA